MNKKFSIFLFSLLLIACAKEKEVQIEPEKKGVTYTLKGYLSEKTRALISDEGTFSWETDDRIAVLDSNTGALCEFVCEEGDGVFTFTGEPGQEYVFTKAWYPASMAQTADQVTFPENWNYSDLSAAHNFPMAATVQDGNMYFYHLCALMKITVNSVPKNATALTLSSPNVSLSGTFAVQELGIDDGRIDATGENVVVEAGEIAVKSVPEVDAETGTGVVSVQLDLSAKQDITVYVPLPCGSYKYAVTLNAGDTQVFQKETKSNKTIDRATLVRMAAISVPWPATALQAVYDQTSVSFEESDLWGWWKAGGLPTGKDISIKESGSSIVYGARHATKKKAGYFVECLSQNALAFPLFQPSDIYLSTDLSKFFTLASGSAAVLPTEYEVAHFALRGNFGSGSYVTKGTFTKTDDKAPSGPWGWYVVRNVTCTADEAAFKLYANVPTPSDGLVVTSTQTRQNVGVGRTLTWSSDGQYPIYYHTTPGMSYDFYLREDLGQVFVYEAGSQGTMDEDRILSLSQYGLYHYNNTSWVYNPGQDQFWTTASSFVLVDGITFDQVQIENLPSTPAVGDAATVTITVTPTIGSVKKTSNVSAEVVKVEEEKVWLLTSNGTGMIVSVQ